MLATRDGVLLFCGSRRLVHEKRFYHYRQIRAEMSVMKIWPCFDVVLFADSVDISGTKGRLLPFPQIYQSLWALDSACMSLVPRGV